MRGLDALDEPMGGQLLLLAGHLDGDGIGHTTGHFNDGSDRAGRLVRGDANARQPDAAGLQPQHVCDACGLGRCIDLYLAARISHVIGYESAARLVVFASSADSPASANRRTSGGFQG